jgi:hypothetical protein
VVPSNLSILIVQALMRYDSHLLRASGGADHVTGRFGDPLRSATLYRTARDEESSPSWRLAGIIPRLSRSAHNLDAAPSSTPAYPSARAVLSISTVSRILEVN